MSNPATEGNANDPDGPAAPLKFLLTSTAPDGRRAVREVAGESAAAVRDRLGRDGHTEIVFHTGDAEAALGRSHGGPPADPPRRQLANRHGRPAWGHFFAGVAHDLRAGWLVYLVNAATLTAFVVMWDRFGDAGHLLAGLAAAVLALSVLRAGWNTLFGSHRTFDRLIGAEAWGRWEEVLELTGTLRGQAPKYFLDKCEAVALAGLGRPGEATAHFAPWVERAAAGEDGAPPPAIARRLMANVCERAGEDDAALAHLRAARESAPGDASTAVDLAAGLMRGGRADEEVRGLLDAAGGGPLSEIEAAFLEIQEGIWRLRTGRPADAAGRLTDALAALESFREANAGVGEVIDRVHAYRAAARAKAGDRAGAEADAALALPRLRATGDRRLTAELAAALDGPGG